MPPGGGPEVPMGACNVCLTHDPAFGGLYRSVQDFSRALAAPVVSFEAGAGERTDVCAGVSVRRIGAGAGPLLRGGHLLSAGAVRLAAAAVDDADLLVVHSLFRRHAIWARQWTRRHGRRYWAVPHGCLDPRGLARRGLPKRLWLEIWGRDFLADAERVVMSSRRSLETASAWVPDGRGVVVHWPVDLPRLDGRADARAAFRGRRGIPEESRLLLFVGRLDPVKRPIETIHAFCEATGAAPPQHCHLAIIGMDGGLSRAAVSAAVPAAWRDRVHVVGPLAGADLADALLAGDGFVSLSYQENFGYAAAEALAYGLPVILSPGHDLAWEMPCREGRFACGWLLDDDAHPTAVAAIRAWATAPEATLAASGGTGRAWVGDTLSFDRFRDRIRALV